MSDIIEYKCPACGGKLEFDSSSQKMKCPFCESEFEVDSIKDHDNCLENIKEDDMNWDSDAGSQWQQGEADNMKVYKCKSCGGEIITDQTTSASKCPYCDNPVVMSGNFSGDLKPDYIIPFKFDKEAAKAALNKHIEGRKLLPKVFRDQNHIDEIKGVYVPVWLFDANAEAKMLFKGEKIRSWSDGKFNYVERNYYFIQREGNVEFEGVPVDGSTKMQDELMESIEPFDFKDAVDFKTAYLSGFLADRYDVSAEESIERANDRIKNTTEQIIAGTVQGYNTVSRENSSVRLNSAKAKYALYPVWILNTTWENQKYIFAMNGQTGKFVGDLPIDKGASARWFLGIAAAVTAVSFGISLLLGLA